MSFFDDVAVFLGRKAVTKEVKVAIQREDEEVAQLIAPVFREIPPNSKAGKFLTEGLRSWAFIAISAIADEISTTKLELYRRSGDGWEDVPTHPALKLLAKPNNFQTQAEFLWLASIYWLSEGEAPLYLNSGKNPTEMVLLNPERLTVIFDDKTIIGGYDYRQSNGKLTRIPAENILMLKMPSLTSPFRGAGVMRYVAQTLDIDNYIEEYLKLFFFNDTTPGAVLETEQELNQTIIQRLKLQFQNRHQGIKNSHKLSVLEKGMKYHKISSGINELQLKELNDLIRDKVLAAFKVPKSILGIVEDVNRANAEQSDATFSKRAVQPKLRMIEGQLNQYLLPLFGGTEGFEFEFENPSFDDKLQEAQINALAIQNGWLTVNEVRAEMGLDPLEEETIDEDTTDDTGDMQEEDDTEEEPTGKYAKPKGKRIREKKRPTTLVEIMKDILASETPMPKKEYSDGELVRFHEDKIMFLKHLEEDYIDRLNKNFRKQKRSLLKQIEGKATKGNSVNLQLDIEAEIEAMIKLSAPLLGEAVFKESELTYALLGLNGKLTSADAVVSTFLKERTLKLGKTTTQTTQDAVDKIVKDWSDTGGAWTDLRANLTEYFDGIGETGAKARADMIARTELANATGFAQQEVYKEVGAVGKKWLTAGDERTCEWCNSMNDKAGNGMTVGISENFFDKGDTLEVEGKTLAIDFEAVDTPPLHPNCRCDIIPVFEESKSNKHGILKALEKRAEAYRAEVEKQSFITAKEEILKQKELDLARKARELEQKEESTKEHLKAVEKTKEQVEAELKEVVAYKDKLNGKARKA